MRLKLRYFRLKREQRIKLKLLLGIPAVRHMRHQGTEHSTAGTGADPVSLDENRFQPGPVRHDSGPEPHDAAADDQEIRHRLTFPDVGTIGSACPPKTLKL